MSETEVVFRKNCMDRKVPIISQATEKFIREILNNQKPELCLEIGSAVGYSGIFMSKLLKERNWKLFSMEVSYVAYLEAIANRKGRNAWNVNFLPFDILELNLGNFFKKPFDFIFIDWHKRNYGEYMQKLEWYVHEKTVIVLDDIIKYDFKLSSLYGYLQKKQISYKIHKIDQDDWVMTINY